MVKNSRGAWKWKVLPLHRSCFHDHDHTSAHSLTHKTTWCCQPITRPHIVFSLHTGYKATRSACFPKCDATERSPRLQSRNGRRPCVGPEVLNFLHLTKSRKYWKDLCFDFLEIACVNAFIPSQTFCKENHEVIACGRLYDHEELRVAIIRQRGRCAVDASISVFKNPVAAEPLAQPTHLPQAMVIRRNCVHCYGTERVECKCQVKCSTCDGSLHVERRDCFRLYHSHWLWLMCLTIFLVLSFHADRTKNFFFIHSVSTASLAYVELVLDLPDEKFPIDTKLQLQISCFASRSGKLDKDNFFVMPQEEHPTYFLERSVVRTDRSVDEENVNQFSMKVAVGKEYSISFSRRKYTSHWNSNFDPERLMLLNIR